MYRQYSNMPLPENKFGRRFAASNLGLLRVHMFHKGTPGSLGLTDFKVKFSVIYQQYV